MVYLLATLANDADYMPSLLFALSGDLSVPELGSAPEAWGVGYYADGRALIIRKPAEILTQRSAFELAPKVQSRILMTCARAGGIGEHTPPFRFRRWLFGHAGNLAPLAELRSKILDRLPDFIRTELGEASGGELAFGMFLAELHRTTLLDDASADPAVLGAALGRTADTIRRLSTESGAGPVEAAYVASNGRAVMASRAGVPLYWKVQEGLEALPEGPPDPAMTDFKQVAAALKRFRAVVVARHVASGRSGWSEIEEGRTLAIDNSLGVRTVDAG